MLDCKINPFKLFDLLFPRCVHTGFISEILPEINGISVMCLTRNIVFSDKFIVGYFVGVFSLI